MKQNFTKEQLLSLIKVVYNLMIADNEEDQSELNYWAQLKKDLRIDEAMIAAANQLEVKEALDILKMMPEAKKRVAATIISDMAKADGVFQEEEMPILTTMLLEAGIEVDLE